MAQRYLVTADTLRSVELSVGDVAVVELFENATTGFRWSVEFDPQLSLLSSERLASSAAVGASGMRRFTFRADAQGTARVNAKLWREWEGDGSVTHRHAFVFWIR